MAESEQDLNVRSLPGIAHATMRVDTVLQLMEETFDVSSFLSFLEKFLKTHEFGFDRQLVEWINQRNETSQAA